MSQRRGLVSPLVEVEVIGAEYDAVKFKTRTIGDNGLNPVWDETFQLKILNPDFALLRLSVYDEDMFGDPNFLGQSTLPVRLVQAGYRSVQLRNGHSEELELSSLLVHTTLSQVRVRRAAAPHTFTCLKLKLFGKIKISFVVAGQHGEQPGGDAAGRGRDLTPAGALGLGPAGVQDIQGEVSQAVISLTNSVNHHSRELL